MEYTTPPATTAEGIERLKALGAPQIIIDNYRRRSRRVGDKSYHVVVRKPLEVKGRCVRKFKTIAEAHHEAQRRAYRGEVGTVVIIYLQCTSMPLDAYYYVRTKNAILSSRSRVYSTEYRKWLKSFGIMKRLEWRKTHSTDEKFPSEPEPEQRYSKRWLTVKALVEAQMQLAKEAHK